MAIKPGDCILRLNEFQRTEYNEHGEPIIRANLITNFLEHIKSNFPDASISTREFTKIIQQELAKFGGKYKETKRWNDRYIKFKSHKHLTLFILTWS